MSEREVAELSEEEEEDDEEDLEEEEDDDDDDEDDEEEASKEQARHTAELEKALEEEERVKQEKNKATEATSGGASARAQDEAKPETPKHVGIPVSSSGASGKGLQGFSALSRLAALSKAKDAAAASHVTQPKPLRRQNTASVIGTLDLNDPKSWVKVLEVDPSLKNLKTLHTSLLEKDGEWLNGFVSSSGFVALLDLVNSLVDNGAPSLFDVVLQLETMGCIRALLNHGQVLASLLTQPDNSNLERLVGLLAGTNLKLGSQILDMLAALCWISEEGRTRTLKAFDTFKKERTERLRFQRLVHSLSSHDDTYKAKVLFLINTLINSRPTPADRMAMREEFLHVGVLPLIEQHCPVDKKALRVQVTVFEDGWVQDAIIVSRGSFRVEPINPYNPLEQLTSFYRRGLSTPKHYAQVARITQALSKLQAPLPVEGEPEQPSALTSIADAVEKAVAMQGKSTTSVEETLRETLVAPLEKQLHKLQESLANQQRYIAELETKLKTAPAPALVAATAESSEANKVAEASTATPPPPPPAKPAATATVETKSEDTAPPSTAPPPPLPPGPPPPPSTSGGSAPPPPPLKGKGPPPPPGSKAGAKGGVAADGLGPRPDVVKPSGPVRRLNWKKIPNALIFASIWKEFTADDPVKLKVNTTKLEDVFSTKKKEEPAAASATAKAVPKVVSLIDIGRANNIGILLNRIKRSGPEVRAALDTADPTFINSPENLEALRKCLPTADELETLKGYEGDKDLLGPVERFMFAILDQANLDKTLEALTFRAQFEMKVAELLTDVRVVSKACEEMRNSSRLREVLRYVVIIGNFLNAGSPSGNAWGVTLETLEKLKDVRGSKNKTLIDFLISTLSEHSPEALKLKEDFTALEGASIVAIAPSKEQAKGMDDSKPSDKLLDITTRMKVLKAGVERLRNSIKKPAEDADAEGEKPAESAEGEKSTEIAEGERPAAPEHPLTKVALEFIVTAEKSLASLEGSLGEVNEAFAALAKLYSFEERFKADDFQSNAVFELLQRFIKHLERVQAATATRQAAKKKKQAAAALRDAQKATGSKDAKAVSAEKETKKVSIVAVSPNKDKAAGAAPKLKGPAVAMNSGAPQLRRFSTRASNVINKKDTAPASGLSTDMDKWRAGNSVLDDIINDVMADFVLTEKEVRTEKRISSKRT